MSQVLVGRQAPDFTVPAVLGNGEIVEEYNFAAARKGKYAVVFFYPLDFTFVCPSELIALHHQNLSTKIYKIFCNKNFSLTICNKIA